MLAKKSRDIINLSLLALMMISLWVDQKLCLDVQSLPQTKFLVFFRDLTDLGKANNYIYFSLGLCVLFYFLRRPNWAEFFAFGAMNFVLSGLLVLLIKVFVGRFRPQAAPGFANSIFDPLTFNHLHQSFPSGHTQVVFSFAFWIAHRFPRLSPVVFTYAILIASTRIVQNVHFLSDIFGGIFVAWVGFCLSDWLKDRLFPAAHKSGWPTDEDSFFSLV